MLSPEARSVWPVRSCQATCVPVDGQSSGHASKSHSCKNSSLRAQQFLPLPFKYPITCLGKTKSVIRKFLSLFSGKHAVTPAQDCEEVRASPSRRLVFSLQQPHLCVMDAQPVCKLQLYCCMMWPFSQRPLERGMECSLRVLLCA